MSDYVSEAEALADIYDGSEIYDKSSTLFLGGIKHGRNILKHRYGNTPKGMYFIIQDCRNGCGSLMLVDRRKSKKFFWTHDCSIALKVPKEQAQKIASKLRYNRARIVKCTTYK